MGEIFLARQQIAGSNRLVVLKRLLPGMAEDARLAQMFVDEARISANLVHPGIVQIYEFGEDADGHFIVMEYVPGHHLGHIVARAERAGRPLPLRLAAYIVHEVARALEHAHGARDSAGAPLEIVHRDVSPSNVLVSYRGDVKLMDFGVARAANRVHRTEDGSVRGKFGYMAPEQIEGQAVDARADVFALGVVAWELTLGRRLFAGTSDVEVIRAALEQPIARPTSIDPYYPPAIEEVVMAALERDRDRRLPTAAAVAAGIKTYLRANPVDRDDVATVMAELYPAEAAESATLVDEHTKPRKPPAKVEAATVALPGAGTPPERRRRWWPLLLVLLIGLCGGGVVVWWRLIRSAPVVAPDAAVAIVDAAVATDAAVESPPVVDAAGPIDAPAASIDASTDAIIEHRKPDARVDHPDAAHGGTTATADAAPAARGSFSFASTEAGEVFLSGDGCTTKSLPGRCQNLVAGTRHTYSFEVPGAGTFTETLEVKPGLTRCEVTPSKRRVHCAP